jgi:hypothetical protein
MHAQLVDVAIIVLAALSAARLVLRECLSLREEYLRSVRPSCQYELPYDQKKLPDVLHTLLPLNSLSKLERSVLVSQPGPRPHQLGIFIVPKVLNGQATWEPVTGCWVCGKRLTTQDECASECLGDFGTSS